MSARPDMMDRMADMWAQGFSLSMVARDVGATRCSVAGKIARARLKGDLRFQPRTPGNQHTTPLAAKSVPEAVGEPRVVERGPLEPCRPRRLVELRPGQCRFPVNAPERGGEFLFCSAPVSVSRSGYCAVHAVLTRAGAGSSGKAAWR
jgi:hypothetical protein